MKSAVRIKDPSEKIEEILEQSKKYGVLSQTDRLEIIGEIKQQGKFPSWLRPDLWMLATAATQAKRNNPNYYTQTDNKLCPYLTRFGHLKET